MAERILIVEDDPTLRRVLRDNLVFEGYRVDAVSDGKSAISYVRASSPDLVVLDLTLPDFDGLDLCPVLRQSGKVPIIILSARGQKADKLKGLKLGADDYITKPFDLQELLARISAVLRRSHPALERLLIGKLVIDFRSQRASCDQAPVHLTHREFELLRYLAERREKVVHREELLREVWGYMDTNVTTRSVDHAIVRLRKKIEPDPHHPEFIRTVHGDGYCSVRLRRWKELSLYDVTQSFLRLFQQRRELIAADRKAARRPGPGKSRRMPCRRRRIHHVPFVRGEVPHRLDVVADLPLHDHPPLGRADVEVPFVVRVVGRQVFLVAPDGLRPHVVVLHDVLPGELRILLRIPQIEVRLVVACVDAHAECCADLHHRVAGRLRRPRIAHRDKRLEVRLVRVDPQRRRGADHFG